MTTATPRTGRVLVVDDHAQARESISDVLTQVGHQVDQCAGAAEALERFQSHRYDVLITDLKMPGLSGLDFICQIEQRELKVQIVMVTAHATVASAVSAMRHGAFDYIEKPFDAEQLERLVERALAQAPCLEPPTTRDPTTRAAHDRVHEPYMVGDSQAMQALLARIGQVAPTSETILISGESGTGKELVARSLHAASPRAAMPCISLNCPVLSAQLLESELFGHERGAFTGAEAPRTGRFELAAGGTILLDEVTEIDLALQAKLLRVLQEKCFERVGSSETIYVDVRVLATTNRDLRETVEQGQFREDLYYRLAVVPIHVPPLRERREDIQPLAEHFLRCSHERLNRPPGCLEPSALDLLTHYHWPGNVRELQNIITRACVLHHEGITADLIKPWLIDSPQGLHTEMPASEHVPVGLSLHEMERKLIEATLEHYQGHRAKTASALGIGLRTLSGKLRSYGYAPRAKIPEK